MTTYQVRDIFGNKLLERDNAEEVRHFIRTRRDPQAKEVWQLRSLPGDLQAITPATDFVHLNPDYDDQAND